VLTKDKVTQCLFLKNHYRRHWRTPRSVAAQTPSSLSSALRNAICTSKLMTSASTGSQVVKATFHYSNQLQTWLQTWFSTRFAARFSTCFRHAFDTLSTFSSKTWSRTCCINLDMLRLMQQVRWLVRVLWNSEFTDVHPEITARITISTHIIGFHFWKHSATHHICVCSL